MTLRKIAAALAAFGLLVGVIGSGVAAQFVDHVTAQENINVGTFACKIVSATPASAQIAANGKSVTYTAPTINSSAPGIAPFSFTVQNTGSIDQALTVSMTGQAGNLTSKFSDIPATPPSFTLTAGSTQLIATGIQWTELDNTDLGRSGSMTWTVGCGEVQGSVVDQVGPVAVTGVTDTGTCNNTWAADSYDKVYTLTQTGPGTYSVQSSESGTFVAAAGTSPGACDSGTDNGGTIGAGVTGPMINVWTNTLTATTSPSSSPDCASNNDCQGASDYLDAVFGSGHYTLGSWNETGYYTTTSNGTWFDTTTNWPTNDVGDITGS